MEGNLRRLACALLMVAAALSPNLPATAQEAGRIRDIVVQGNERLRAGQEVQIQRIDQPAAGNSPTQPEPVSEAKLR